MLRRRPILIVLALLGACAHGRTHRPGDEWLAKVDFEGNQRMSDKKLLTGLALHRTLKRGRAPDPYVVQVDADRIRGEYLRKGYLDVDVRSRVERKGDQATVIYTVEEGVRATTRIVINGLPPEVKPDTVLEQLPLKNGQPFDYEKYDLAKPTLLGAVQDAGYAHATMTTNVVADRANHVAVVELTYVIGPRCVFGPIKVTGVKGELAEAVQHRITFAQGQQYSQAAVTQTQRNLYGFGRFSTVRVQPDKTGNPVVGVEVAVSESARHEVKLGGGFGLDPNAYEVRGRAGYTIAGWPWPLDTVSLDLRPAYALLRNTNDTEPRVRALAKLERKDLLWTFTTSDVQAGYNYLTVEAYTQYGPLASLGFETPVLTDKLRARVGWGIQQVNFSHPSDVLPIETQIQIGLRNPDRSIASERLGAFQQSVVLDLRDHPIEPRLGAYAEVRVAEGTKYAGSSLDYIEVVPDVRGYVPLYLGGAILALHGRVGGIYGDVPLTERFFGGGATGQRGFSERKLSPSVVGPPLMSNGLPQLNDKDMPKGEQEVPYGGAGLIETSAEARIPITKVKDMPLGAVVFLDGGDVTERPADLDITNLHWAIGAGLRLQTIVGPVRLDFGYRLNRTGAGEPDPGSHFAYHLTIGEAF